MIELQLHENWQLCDIKKQDWIPAQVPGDIYSALLKAERCLIHSLETTNIRRKR